MVKCQFTAVEQGVYACEACGRRVRSPTPQIEATCGPPAPCGPGCHLARLFAWFGLRDDGTCGCAAYAAKMDAWGPDGCTEREDEIVGHLAEMAVRRGLPFVPLAARLAVRQAVANARRDAAPAPADAGPG